MLGGERASRRRRARLEDDGPALRGSSGPEGPVHVEIATVVVGHPDPADVIEDSRDAILDDRVLAPRVPQLLDDLDGLLGNSVPLIVIDHATGAGVVGRGPREAGDQIPPGSTTAEMVE